jgi:hypothetical protein
MVYFSLPLHLRKQAKAEVRHLLGGCSGPIRRILQRLGTEESKWALHYISNNREAIAQWKDKTRLNYWIEGDIGRVLKSKMGQGKRILSVDSFRNLLQADGVHLL